MAAIPHGRLPPVVALAAITSGGDPLADFDHLPPSRLIASRPPPNRADARLLDLTGDHPVARHMRDFPALLRPGDLLAVNDSRVIPARMHGHKTTGGRVEILTERVAEKNRILAQVRPARGLKPGAEIILSSPPTHPSSPSHPRSSAPDENHPEEHPTLRAEKREGDLWEFSTPIPAMELLRRVGAVPLPPYIRRRPDAGDAARYQTVFARRDGSVAAPTAGLHFSAELLEEIKARDVEVAALTLHVGAGTFAPLRGDAAAHKMHSERFFISESTALAVRRARKESRRIVAAGTTTLRALETSALRNNGEVRAGGGETDLFVREGFCFRAVDALLTNFHPPRSTPLLLVCAFGGRRKILEGYHFAAARDFRFFSYGDATLLARGK